MDDTGDFATTVFAEFGSAIQAGRDEFLALKQKYDGLCEDYRYNLSVISERDSAIAALKSQVATLQDRFRSRETEIQAVQATLRDENNTLRTELAKRTQEITEIDSLKAELARFKERASQQQARADDLSARLADTAMRVEAVRAAAQSLSPQQEISARAEEERAAEVASLRDQLAHSEKREETLRKQCVMYDTQLMLERQTAAKARSELDNTRGQVALLEAELERIGSAPVAAPAAQAAIAAAREEADRARTELQLQRDKTVKLQEMMSRMREEMGRVQLTVQEGEAGYRAQVAALTSETEELHARIRGLTSDAEQRIEVAVEEARRPLEQELAKLRSEFNNCREEAAQRCTCLEDQLRIAREGAQQREHVANERYSQLQAENERLAAICSTYKNEIARLTLERQAPALSEVAPAAPVRATSQPRHAVGARALSSLSQLQAALQSPSVTSLESTSSTLRHASALENLAAQAQRRVAQTRLRSAP